MKRFTLDEASSLLGEIAPLLETLSAAHATMEERHDDVMTSIPTNGGGQVHREFTDAARDAAAASGRLDELGVIVRDPSTGLIDFPAEREGVEVFLCWRLGEPAIEWWHPTDTGFSGRRPL